MSFVKTLCGNFAFVFLLFLVAFTFGQSMYCYFISYMLLFQRGRIGVARVAKKKYEWGGGGVSCQGQVVQLHGYTCLYTDKYVSVPFLGKNPF